MERLVQLSPQNAKYLNGMQNMLICLAEQLYNSLQHHFTV